MKMINGSLYITTDELVEMGINRQTIINGIHMFKINKNQNWEHIAGSNSSTYNKNPLINFDSIPVVTRKKLPLKSELLKKVVEELELINKANVLATV